MSILNTSLIHIEPGFYTTRIKHYEVIKYDGREAYIAVHMTVDDVDIVDRIYPKRVNYIMYRLRQQLRITDRFVTLSQLLNLASSHNISIYLDYDPRFGRCIDYIEA